MFFCILLNIWLIWCIFYYLTPYSSINFRFVWNGCGYFLCFRKGNPAANPHCLQYLGQLDMFSFCFTAYTLPPPRHLLPRTKKVYQTCNQQNPPKLVFYLFKVCPTKIKTTCFSRAMQVNLHCFQAWVKKRGGGGGQLSPPHPRYDPSHLCFLSLKTQY
jgi:hypothetical protein